jgi:hypothetical protein
LGIQKCPLTNEEKHNMIAEAAFLGAEKRDFPGDPVADWLAAEAEIEDALTAYCRSEDQEQEYSAYQRIRTEVHRVLEKAEETVNAEAIRQALEKVTGQLRQAGEFVPETIDRASKAVKQEIAGSIGKLGYNWDHFRINQSELLASWKDKGTHTMSRTTKSFYDWLNRWRNRNDG